MKISDYKYLLGSSGKFRVVHMLLPLPVFGFVLTVQRKIQSSILSTWDAHKELENGKKTNEWTKKLIIIAFSCVAARDVLLRLNLSHCGVSVACAKHSSYLYILHPRMKRLDTDTRMYDRVVMSESQTALTHSPHTQGCLSWFSYTFHWCWKNISSSL